MAIKNGTRIILVFLLIPTLTLVGLIIIELGYFADEFNLFQSIDLHEEAEWLLVKTDLEQNRSVIISDRKLLLELHSDVKLKVTESCGGTTPDNGIYLYKNGKIISYFWYCSWEFGTFDFGKLETAFVRATEKSINAKNIEHHKVVLDSLTQLKNIYLLYPDEPSDDLMIRYYQWNP